MVVRLPRLMTVPSAMMSILLRCLFLIQSHHSVGVA